MRAAHEVVGAALAGAAAATWMAVATAMAAAVSLPEAKILATIVIVL